MSALCRNCAILIADVVAIIRDGVFDRPYYVMTGEKDARRIVCSTVNFDVALRECEGETENPRIYHAFFTASNVNIIRVGIPKTECYCSRSTP